MDNGGSTTLRDDSFTFVDRNDWGALQSSFVPSITNPAKMIMVGFPQMRYSPKGKPWLGHRPTYECALSEIRFIQKQDIKKYPDIKYNFLIAPEGIVFEGRGWEKIPTLPTKYKEFAHISYYIMFIGDFTEHPPGEDYYKTREKLIQHGVKNNHISKKFLFHTMESKVKCPFEPYDHNAKTVNVTKY